jgi:CHAD domain-containing protein
MNSAVLTEALARQLTRCSRELSRARLGVVRGVHQARVASRRLREGLGALDGALPSDIRHRLLKMLRELSRTLGAVRECDVTLGLAATEAAQHEWPESSVALIRAALEEERARHHRALVKTLTASEWRSAIVPVRNRFRQMRAGVNHTDALAAARNRRIKRARALSRDVSEVGALYVPDQLHAIRIATKKLRYALEWEQQIGRKGWLRERKVLEAAQEELGEWHDRLVLQERIHRLRRSGDFARPVAGDFKRMAADLERECRARHAAILGRVPALLRVTNAAQERRKAEQ